MNKKEYMIPTCEVVELEGTVYMQAGSVIIGSGTDVPENELPLESNRHRGEWGNLWN